MVHRAAPFITSLIRLRHKFVIEHDKRNPTALYLTYEDEIKIIEDLHVFSPHLRDKIILDGVPASLPQLLNATVHYGSESTRFE